MEAKPELKYIFTNINDWLKFAEAKLGGLIVLNAGLVVGILSSYNNIQIFIYKPLVLAGVVCFGISVFLCIISQFPVIKNVFYNKKTIKNTNLYFFGHLAHLDNQAFVTEFKKIDSSIEISKFDNDLINQILVNARITEAKFVFFKVASYFTTFGSGIIGLSSIIKIIWHY